MTQQKDFILALTDGKPGHETTEKLSSGMDSTKFT